MERGRRGASRSDAAKEKVAALAAARASGKKRVDTFEPKHEAAVYDEARLLDALPTSSRRRVSRAHLQLNEKEYRTLVAKRRMETGGFIVGDAQGGCGAARCAAGRAA